MNIPLDRLYNFLGDVCNQDVIIYRFFPHGSKNFNDCSSIREYSWQDMMTRPHVLCYDQETIDVLNFPLNHLSWSVDGRKYPSRMPFPWFKSRTKVPYQLFNHVILVHSEHNSEIIEAAAAVGYLPVHWFVHGIIARDWFRYAEVDPTLVWAPGQYRHKFLCYNRAWAGTREYRLKFAELLIQHNLVEQCATTVGFIDDQKHYSEHKFSNPAWQVTTKLEYYFQPNNTQSTASADYNSRDYQQTAIEVVLETHFDTRKNHLTEKSLRPIAVGKPFILAASAHGLKYLRQYGFQTFEPWINESYDDIEDPAERLNAVVKEMQRLNSLSPEEFAHVEAECLLIAKQNQQRFFSDEFFEQVVEEFKQGMDRAIAVCKEHASLDNWQQWSADHPDAPDIEPVLKTLSLGKYQHELVQTQTP